MPINVSGLLISVSGFTVSLSVLNVITLIFQSYS